MVKMTDVVFGSALCELTGSTGLLVGSTGFFVGSAGLLTGSEGVLAGSAGLLAGVDGVDTGSTGLLAGAEGVVTGSTGWLAGPAGALGEAAGELVSWAVPELSALEVTVLSTEVIWLAAEDVVMLETGSAVGVLLVVVTASLDVVAEATVAEEETVVSSTLVAEEAAAEEAMSVLVAEASTEVAESGRRSEPDHAPWVKSPTRGG
jgi:hypothetical protein